MGDHQHHLLGGKYKKIKWTANQPEITPQILYNRFTAF